ncbi:MAG: nucleotidyltransferase family protein [Deltaproteobacteria bacterium]|nr:nucleotidyltransferase family protein [Deltaproteobacteria bacterium]
MNRSLSELTIPPSSTLLEALRAIDRAAIELVFVGDERGVIIGTLSDGDVRRQILKGTPLDEPRAVESAMCRKFIWLRSDVSRAEALDVMRARSISQLPVLDEVGRLIGLHLLHDLIGGAERPNCAVIMAGGQGIRLRPLTENVPKPMLKVAGRPILERLVLHLVGYGIKHIYLSVNYLGHVIEDHFGDGTAFGCRIEYLREQQPLGTGGPLSLLPQPSHAVVVLNGDLVTQANIDRAIAFHEQGGFLATACLRPYQLEVPFGVADVSGDVLVGVREKPTEQLLINAGIYVLSPAAIALVPRDRSYPITELLDTCLQAGNRVGAHVLDGEWLDVGRHEELNRARGLP